VISPAHSHPPPTGRAVQIATASVLLVAMAWLASRVVLGLDFTDEMQYYGQIESLVRTGRFFQNDLFLQQLGYLFALPFFKLHAVVFPDQRYLIVFGRLLLLVGYATVGWLFWRTSARRGGFSVVQRQLGLAAFCAWIPFQLFALSYNTLAYLLLVALGCVRWTRAGARFRPTASASAALMAILTFSYPPAGLVAILAVAIDEWRHAGVRLALGLLTLTLAAALAIIGVLFALHGSALIDDFALAIAFSRGFTSGAILQPEAFWAWVVALAATALFLGRTRRGPGFGALRILPTSTLAFRVGRAVCIVAAIVLAKMSFDWSYGYVPAALLLLLLIAVGGCADGRSPRTLTIGVVVGVVVVWLLSARWATGHFAASAYLGLLALLATFAREDELQAVAPLALAGALLGTVFAFTSGNGIHNFGVGAAAVVPWLVLYGARAAVRTESTVVRALALPAALVVVVLFLVNAALYPYREQPAWKPFRPAQHVPAFAGIWTSPTKTEAIDTFSRFFGLHDIAHRRLFVAGPHPWLYFVARGQPATPMLFMHFTVREENYEFAAKQLFRGGKPDAVVIANGVPRSIQARLSAWAAEGCTAENLPLRDDFRRRYARETRQEFGDQVTLLIRPPAARR